MASRIAPVAPGLDASRQLSLRQAVDHLWEEFRQSAKRGPDAWALAERIEALQEALWPFNDAGPEYHPFVLLIDEGPSPLAENGATAACPR